MISPEGITQADVDNAYADMEKAAAIVQSIGTRFRIICDSDPALMILTASFLIAITDKSASAASDPQPTYAERKEACLSVVGGVLDLVEGQKRELQS